MYSIMCVYMHHICTYNVYVYIFVVSLPPSKLFLFFNHFGACLYILFLSVHIIHNTPQLHLTACVCRFIFFKLLVYPVDGS